MIDPSKVRVSGPLELYAPGFVVELGRQGYRPLTTVHQMRLMAHLSRWLAGERLDATNLAATVVDEFVAARCAVGYTTLRSRRALAPLLGYLRVINVVPMALPAEPETRTEVLLERYREYLTVERGLTAGTAYDYVHAVRPFLAARDAKGELDLEHLSAGAVTAFVVARCPDQARGSAKLTVTTLRSLLGFLHVEGVIAHSLVGAVPSWRLAGLPRALEPEQVRRLLRSCDRRTTTGRRDFAILTVLVRLGLRAGEVAGLGLDDVDWRAGVKRPTRSAYVATSSSGMYPHAGPSLTIPFRYLISGPLKNRRTPRLHSVWIVWRFTPSSAAAPPGRHQPAIESIEKLIELHVSTILVRLGHARRLTRNRMVLPTSRRDENAVARIH